jgi:glycolate oxidase FAD binding subunit
MVACGVSGPRRISAGACRDALLGIRFVDGTGEAVKSGGRVMKNVTGYDLVKLLCGSHGTLGVLTEASLKLEPAPERALSLVLEGLGEAEAVAAMAAAMGTPYAVSGAAHLPGEASADGTARTLLRVEGMAEQAGYRAAEVARALMAHGAAREVEGEEHEALWRAVRDVEPFAGRVGAVWRLSLKPSEAPAVVQHLRRTLALTAFYDWAGGLVWLLVPEEGDAGASAIRAETQARGGHATLVRAAEPTRAAVEVFEPEPGPLAAISARLRARFDPQGVLNPGRMRV